MNSPSNFYVVGGTVRRDAPCYIQRQADAELFDSLLRGEYSYVLTPRQMGKSSLMIHTAAHLREAGALVIVLDLTAAGQHLNVEQWYGGLLMQMGQQLNLDDELLEYWQSHSLLSPLQRWTTAIRKVVLPRYFCRIVIFVDEIDAVHSLSFSTDEFFAGIREFYNHRSQDEDLELLTFCLLGVATPSDLIRDTRRTPFNIGRRIELSDFTEEEAMPLSRGLNRDEETNKLLLKRIIHWTNGHPYLTQRLCKTVSNKQTLTRSSDVDSVCAELFLSSRARERDSNLLFVREQLLRSETDLTALLELYRSVYRQSSGRPVCDDETNPLFSILQLSGITRVERGALVVRNRIYSSAFNQEWIKANMPDADLRRQRAAYRQGILRAAVAGIIVSLVFLWLALFAFKQRDRAEQQKSVNRRLLYAAQMNLAGQAWDHANISGLSEMIEAHVPENGQEDLRGFEWHLYQRLLHSDRATLQHTAEVLSVAFSPDGKLLATGGKDNLICLWDVSTGQLITKLQGHLGPVWKVTFSPDGSKLASSGWDNSVRIWNVASNTELMIFAGHTDHVCGLAFSPDGLKLATGSWDKRIKIWDLSKGKELRTLSGHGNWVWSVEFSPKGDKLASASEDHTIRLWDIETGNEERVLTGLGASVYGATFSPDGSSLATCSNSGDIKIWDMKTGDEIATLKGHTSSVNSIVFSADGKRLASTGVDRLIRIWDITSKKEIFHLKGHSDEIRSLAFSPDGRTLASAGDDLTVKFWDMPKDAIPDLLMHPEERVDSLCISPDGKTLAASNESSIFFWDVHTGRMLSNITTGSPIYDICFSPDRSIIAAAHRNATITLWNSANNQPLGLLTGHREIVSTISFSPDGKWLVSGSRDHLIKIWDWVAKKEIATLSGHERRVGTLAFSVDGKYLASGSDDQTIKIWDTAKLYEIAGLVDHANEVWSVAFSPDGSRLASGSNDRSIIIWDWKNRVELKKLKGHSAGVRALVFSPDGKRLVSGSEDRTIKLWEVDSGNQLTTINGHTATVTALAFTPDGLTLASSGRDYTVRLWRANSISSGVR